MEGVHRGRRAEMEDIFNPNRALPDPGAATKVETINSNGHGASRMYVVRSKPALPDPYRGLNVSKSPLPKPASNSKSRLFGCLELKRRKRVAKYKWYALEGRVKASLKNGCSWFKRRCYRLVNDV